MPLLARDITSGRQDQGSGETVVYSLTTTNWGSDPSSPSVTVYDITDDDADVTSAVASGSASASGDVITFPAISSLTAGHIYRADVQFTIGSSTLVVPVYIECNPFTYIGDLSTDRDKVRFHLGDTDPRDGPLPSDKNFTDNEIDGLIDAEGTWQRAVAAGFEALAAAWARYPSFKADGLSLSRSDIVKAYKDEAAKWRRDYGRTRGVNVAGIIKRDGYSDDVTSDDVDTDSEYEADFEYVKME
jgi:hypothetical protein